MNLLISPSDDPYRNLATEEYLLKNSDEDFIYLFVNKPCVVVGKHQNVQKEIDSNFIYDNNILVSRRLSGGGAVFHDEGNLNFSFIQSVSFGENISYKNITQSIFTFLKQLAPSITLSERNDFLLDGSKISGSAMHVYKNRVIAHCTLLIDCNLSNLSASLKGNQDRYKDKSIASVRSKVTNLSKAIENISIKSLTTDFSDYIQTENLTVNLISLPEATHYPISNLVTNKYSTQNWIFGYSPKYTYSSTIRYDKNIINYILEVEKGIIERLIIESNNELSQYISLQLKSLEGKYHNIYALKKWLNTPHASSFNQFLLNSLF